MRNVLMGEAHPGQTAVPEAAPSCLKAPPHTAPSHTGNPASHDGPGKFSSRPWEESNREFYSKLRILTREADSQKF